MGMPVRGDLLAAYGEMLSGLDSHQAYGLRLRSGLVLRGSCWIPGILYDLGDYPALVPGTGQVLGELYEVSDSGLFEDLDWFETWDLGRESEPEYVRCLIPLIEPEIEAWVYMYDRDPGGNPVVESGDWRGYVADRMRLR